MYSIKNLNKAANRIKKAVRNKERIILYGDADLDGVSSVIILKETIKNIGGDVALVFFPDREDDGYGITEKALEELKNLAPALLISLDLGISSFKEAKIAKKMGFEVMVIDHHQPLDKLPDVSIIVDPKQKGDKYPFKEFATAGIVFNLSQEILGKNFSESPKNSFLELTALATLADMMSVEKENKILIDQGLFSLKKTFRPGLKVFSDILEGGIFINNNLQKITSALNSCGRTTKDRINEAYFLLTSASVEEAKEIAKNLIVQNLEKKTKTKEIVQEIENRIKNKQDNIVFEGDSFWSLALAGSVASTICNKYQKPTFIFKKGEKESCGSVRAPKGVNSVDAMATCSDFLITYGGHPPASGFRIKNEDLERFRECLIRYFERK